jgi:hypothetical protein
MSSEEAGMKIGKLLTELEVLTGHLLDEEKCMRINEIRNQISSLERDLYETV